MKSKKIIVSILTIILSMFFIGCGGGSGGSNNDPVTPASEKIIITASGTEIRADSTDFVKLTAKTEAGKDITNDVVFKTEKANVNVSISKNILKIGEKGSYTIIAEKGGVISNKLTISAKPLTIHFKKPDSWSSDIHIYYWNVFKGTQAVDTSKIVWPGVTMTDEGNGWYIAELGNITSANIIINDLSSSTDIRKNKTVDIENVGSTEWQSTVSAGKHEAFYSKLDVVNAAQNQWVWSGGWTDTKPVLPSIEEVVFPITNATVKVNANYILPSTATVKYSDGTVKTTIVSWDNNVDTSKTGNYSFNGKVVGTDKTVQFTLTVTASDVEVKIESVMLDVDKATIKKGTAFTLPQTAIALMNDGSKKQIAVKMWDKKVDIQTVGTTVFTGIFAETSLNVKFTLTVNSDTQTFNKIEKLILEKANATVKKGDSYTLLSKATAIMTDGTSSEVPITWDRKVDTSKAGTYVFTGVTAGSTLTVMFTLVVQEKDIVSTIESLVVDPDKAKVQMNSYYSLPAVATAVYTNGAKKQVSLTWDKPVTTSKKGTTIFKGSAKETTMTVLFVLEVTDMLTKPDIYDLTLSPDTAKVKQNSTDFRLPSQVLATYTDGSTEMVDVKWDRTPNTGTVGTYQYMGSVDGTTKQVVFTLEVLKDDGQVTPVTITKLSVYPDNATVNIGDKYSLPATGTATYSNGTTKSVSLTWDKQVNTSVAGTFLFTGTSNGLTVYFTLNVKTIIIAKVTDVKLDIESASVNVNDPYTLPANAKIFYDDGTIKYGSIVWDKAVDTRTAGIYNFNGVVYGTEKMVKFALTVNSVYVPPTVVSVAIDVTSATVKVNETYTLPSTAVVRMSDGTTKNGNVSWDKVVNTATAGTYVFNGAVSGTDKMVAFTLTVIPNGVVYDKMVVTFTDKTAPVMGIVGIYANIKVFNPSIATLDIYQINASGETFRKTLSGIVANTQYKEKVTVTTDATSMIVRALDASGNIVESTTVNIGATTLTVTALTVTPTTTTVNVGDVFALPVTGTATYNDGSAKSVTLAWDKQVSTATAGTYTFIGSTAGTTMTVTFTLTVKANTATITGLAVTPTTATVNVGDAYTLPATGTATYSDATTKSVTLTWDKQVSTATAGTYTFIGSAAGTTRTVTFTLTVKANTVTITGLVVTPTTAKVKVGETYTLPATGTATYSDSTTKSVALTWDKQVNTATAGTYTFTGTTAGSTRTVTFTLTVEASQVALPVVTITDKKAPVMGLVGATANVTVSDAKTTQVRISAYTDAGVVERLVLDITALNTVISKRIMLLETTTKIKVESLDSTGKVISTFDQTI